MGGSPEIAEKTIFEKAFLVFLFTHDFSRSGIAKCQFIGARWMKVDLDFEPHPILAENISQSVADLADGTIGPDRSQDIINQVSVSQGRASQP